MAGLLIGIVLGAVGVGLIGAMWRHGSHHGPAGGPFGRGDDRGQYNQDNRVRPNYR